MQSISDLTDADACMAFMTTVRRPGILGRLVLFDPCSRPGLAVAMEEPEPKSFDIVRIATVEEGSGFRQASGTIEAECIRI